LLCTALLFPEKTIHTAYRRHLKIPGFFPSCQSSFVFQFKSTSLKVPLFKSVPIGKSRRHGNQKAGKPPASPYSTRAPAFQPPHKEPVASPHIKTGGIPDGLLHILLLLLSFRINKDKMDRHACPYRLSFLIAEAMQVLLQ
jgi:hypothetical protein